MDDYDGLYLHHGIMDSEMTSQFMIIYFTGILVLFCLVSVQTYRVHV